MYYFVCLKESKRIASAGMGLSSMGEDLRVVKTKRAIEGAMEKLLTARSFEDITVQAILDEALVNRKTFYSHYRDKYDLVRVMADSFLADIDALVEERKSLGARPQGPFVTANALYERLLEKRDLALALWNVRCEGLDFQGELRHAVEDAYLSYFGVEGEGDAHFQAALGSAMLVAMLRFKLEAGEPFTIENTHRELSMLTRRMLGDE